MIFLSEQHHQEIQTAAEAAYPAECCGLLIGHIDAPSWHISGLVTSPNIVADQGNDHFEIDPQIIIDQIRELRGSDRQIIGHYHSHPNHPAEPSATDLKMAYELAMIWLIAAVHNGTMTDLKAHHLTADQTQFNEISINITES